MRIPLCLSICLWSGSAWAQAAGTTIDFELGAPVFFVQTSPLSNEYSSRGVTFSGDGGVIGGSVVNQSSWTTPAFSGTDALSFNIYASTGLAERIEFTKRISSVSLWAAVQDRAGGAVSMKAFDQAGNLLGEVTGGRAGQYTRLSISGVGFIKYIVVSKSTGSAFTIDDLYFLSGPDSSNTTVALRRNSASIRAIMDRRITGLAMMSNYDCQTFDKHGVCLSFQVRYTNFTSFNEGAGVLTASYRLSDNVRIGTFVDYRTSEKEPTNIKFSNDLPTFGTFVGYSQHLNGTGLQGKVLAAVQKGNTTITRDNSLTSTEPGSGKGSLNSYMVSGELGWGFAVSPSMLATPYVGLRYTDATRGGYTEDTVSGTVDYPVSYSDYSQRLTTATIGVRLAGMLTEKVGYQIGAGIEHDLQQKTSTYSGTSTISGLETFSLNVDGVKNRTRGVGSVGMFYQVEKNQRLMGNVSIRNQAYTSQNAISAMAGYQVAF